MIFLTFFSLVVLTTAAFENETVPNPHNIDKDDIVIDDMIYNKDQFLKDYHNIR